MIKAQELTRSGDVIAYGSGWGHIRISKGLIGLAVAFGVAFIAVLVVLGQFLIPGFLLILIAVGLLQPRRGVALTANAVFLLHESMVNAMPTHVLFAAQPSVLMTEEGAGSRYVRLRFGDERLRIKRKEFEPLRRAAQQLPALQPLRVSGPGVAAAWYPDPSGRHQHRYWDGWAWSQAVSDNGVMSVDEPT